VSPDEDPNRLRQDAPLLDGWLRFREGERYPWTTPGHKGRTDQVGPIVESDVPLYGGVDTVRSHHSRLTDAEARLARLWGADWARISVGGSTHGNQTLCLAVGQPGDTVVVNRNMHRSLLSGLVLSGLVPVWVTPDIEPTFGLPSGVPTSRVEAALADHPDAVAVFLVEPSYIGTMSDVAAHARAAHSAGVPLLIDQAWGAHFGFHPSLPGHALALGADALVTSAHKTLPAYTQAAYVMARGQRLNVDQLQRAFDTLDTTSPSGTIAASADAARAYLARDGARATRELVVLVEAARQRLLSEVPQLAIFDGRAVPIGVGFDPVKLVISLAGTGASGLAVEETLIGMGHPIEMADRDTLVPLVTIADDEASLNRFVDALVVAISKHRGPARDVMPSVSWTLTPQTVVPPRDAFFARHAVVAMAQAVGRVSSELVAPYPPGIPVLAPGERVTEEAVAGLRLALEAGIQVRYAADPTLETLHVIA
jgi:arginine decarboxylase